MQPLPSFGAIHYELIPVSIPTIPETNTKNGPEKKLIKIKMNANITKMPYCSTIRTNFWYCTESGYGSSAERILEPSSGGNGSMLNSARSTLI
jgi:hypothetical protein